MKKKNIPDETQQIIDTVSRFLKCYRWQNDYSQHRLAELSGIHYNTISKIESGHSYNIVTLIEICLALDLPLRELFWEL